jgi:large subunit ribosomal protein L2
MAQLLALKPTSPGRRGTVRVQHKHLSKEEPKRSLVKGKKRISARNNAGRITVRHRGGGHKALYRTIDFLRNKDNVPARVVRIEYDPNRTAHIALLSYTDGAWAYILAPKGLRQDMNVTSGPDAPIKMGNTLPLTAIPVGTVIHAIELHPGGGAKFARSAGSSSQLISKEEEYALIRMRSGEVRKFNLNVRATIGEVSNGEHNLAQLGKAGAKRWRGWRPTVRGVAMNPVDHPHGGGEGRTSGGRHPVSPTGVLAKGKRTRSNKRTDKYIVRSRKNK